jgi:phosphoserine aminotransferase
VLSIKLTQTTPRILAFTLQLQRPADPCFSSGPCKKRPGWSLDGLKDTPVGRSHRSAIGKKKLKEAIEESKRILQIPEGYKLGIVPASDTGAFEMAMWSVLGAAPIDVFHWESFGKGWASDISVSEPHAMRSRR